MEGNNTQGEENRKSQHVLALVKKKTEGVIDSQDGSENAPKLDGGVEKTKSYGARP